MTGLLGPEKRACTSDFQIPQSNFYPGSEGCKVTNRIEPFFGVLRKHFVPPECEIGTRPPGRPADTAANLMKLSKAKPVGVLNDQRIDIGNINAGFDDGGTDENLHFSAHNTIHHVGKHLPVHPAVCHSNRYLAAQKFRNLPGCTLNVINPIMEIIDLSAALEFPHHGVGKKVPVMLHDKCLHRKPILRRLFQVGHIPNPRHGHIHGTGNRRCREREDIYASGEFLDMFLVRHAEALFLVDDQQPQLLKLNIL